MIASELLAESGHAWDMLDNRKSPATGQTVRYERLVFEAIPGWADDDHAAAFRAFLVTCGGKPGPGKGKVRTALKVVSGLAQGQARAASYDKGVARKFFENSFQAWQITSPVEDGFLTGYYEPVLEGSLTRDERHKVPVLRRPKDLKQLVDHRLRAVANATGALTAARRVDGRLVPYYTRAEIEEGALDGRGLELVYLRDPIAAFFMHVQGSGRIKLPDGRVLRIGYDGKNGQPYTSIGGVLVSRGVYSKDEINLETLRSWLAANPGEGRKLMQENRSYIFFKERPSDGSEAGPIGGHGTPLSAGRSLAVDAAYHVLGTPVFVSAPTLTHHGEAGFRHLLIAQDVGSAIKGAERGDIYWGSGTAAETLAGLTRHSGNFVVLLPKDVERPE